MSLADAREKRGEAWSMLCEGQDPNVAKRLKIEANIEASRQTFERMAREWHANAKAQWATIHASEIIRSLERDVFPTIGALPIAQLTPPLILGVLREIEVRGAIETAKRVRQRISAVCVYAIAQGVAISDPAEKLGAVLKPLRKGRQPATTELAPLRKFLRLVLRSHQRSSFFQSTQQGAPAMVHYIEVAPVRLYPRPIGGSQV